MARRLSCGPGLSFRRSLDWTGCVLYDHALFEYNLNTDTDAFVGLQSGLGLFLNEINMPVETALERSRLLLWNIELFYAFSLASAKLAILGFYWRMFKTSNLKRPIQTLVGCTLIWTIIRVRTSIVRCISVIS